MADRNGPRLRCLRMWSAVVVAGLILGATAAPARADVVTARPNGTFTRISVSDPNACALTPAGVAGCWGDVFGDAPAMLPGRYREISVDWRTECGLRTDDTIVCWGENEANGRPALPGKFRSVSAGGDSVCGIRVNGDLACAHFEKVEDDHRPTYVPGPFSSVSVAGDVCAVTAAGDVVCWALYDDSPRPQRTVGPFTAVSVGFEHTCALRADRNISCWGENGQGQAPARVSGPFTALDAGREATCAIRVDRDLACWGATDPPPRTRGPFASVSVGAATCALDTGGQMTCWGDPENMQMPRVPDPLSTPDLAVRVGDAVFANLEAEGAPPAQYSTHSPMPIGLELTSDAMISGTPRKLGTYRIDVTATNLFGSITVPFTIRVGPTTDFDANGDGLPDLVVGVPGEKVGRARNAGTVDILLGSPTGRYGSAGALRIAQEDLAQTSERNDRFGATLCVADVTGDGVMDLIVGAPGEDAGAGQVVVVWGSASGLIMNSPTVLAQGLRAAAGAAEPGDGFGSSISVGDGLWIGAPGEDLAGAADAGVATRFPIKPLTSKGSVQYRQGIRGVPGTPERGDRFGAALGHGGSIIGVPGEDVGHVVDAGTVVWKLKKSISQRSRGVPGRVERGDQFGASVAAREVFGHDENSSARKRFLLAAVGAPGEDVNARKDAGTALLIGETYGRKREYTTIGPARGTAETGDRFGSVVAFPTRPTPEFSDFERLVVGAPGEDIAGRSNAGAVRVVPLSRYCEDPCGSDAFPEDPDAVTVIQGRRQTPGTASSGNRFGAAVARLPGVEGAILIASPGQIVAGEPGAGAVTVLDPDPVRSHQIQKAAVRRPKAYDQFGTLPGQ